MATFVKRGDSWQAKVRRQGYPPITRSFDTKAKAEMWARDMEGSRDRHVFVDHREAENTTLRDALERYEREVTPAKKGARQERSRILKWTRDPLAARSMASIRGADLAAWRCSPTCSPWRAGNGGWKAFRTRCARSPCPPPARACDRRLQGDEEARLLDACGQASTPWLKPLVQLALETGMRQGELLALRWERVDLPRRVVDTKNGEARDVPLSWAAVTVLRDLSRCLDGRVFLLNGDQVAHFFTRATAQAGIADLRFHDLRHEATSRLFERGQNPMEAAAVTGHKTLQMLKRYTHLRAEDLAAKLGSALSPKL